MWTIGIVFELSAGDRSQKFMITVSGRWLTAMLETYMYCVNEGDTTENETNNGRIECYPLYLSIST